MPLTAWKSVVVRTWQETTRDNIGLIAAGVAFYGFLALLPLLGAIVLLYGLVADADTVMRDLTQLASVMPADTATLIGDQLLGVVETSDGKKGLALVLALGLSLFGARNAAGAVIIALNIAYEEDEKRGFIHVNLLAIGITATAVLVAMLAAIAVAALGYLGSLLPEAPRALVVLGKVGAYVTLAFAGAAAAATLYRYGPSRRRARWMWLTPGSAFAALAWLLLTIGFGIYVASFGNYNATYGSLGAVVVTLTWLYLSSYILLFGAELNSELEHQTAQDTTRSDAPLGERGAWVADHVADRPDAAQLTSASAQSHANLVSDSDITAMDHGGARLGGFKMIAASRIGARMGTTVGLAKVGWLTSVGATVGLALIRKEGRAVHGLVVLGSAAGLAWFTRDRQDPGV